VGCSSSTPGTTAARAHADRQRPPEGGPVSLAPGKVPFPSQNRITRYLTSLATAGHLSGTVLVSRGGHEYLAAYGYADRATRTPNTITTEFRLGSVSKQFTAMAVLLLTARHELTITGTICRYLPGRASTFTSLGYGFGWFIDRTPDGLRHEHEGRIDGYLSYNAIYPASGEHIVVLANSEATPVRAIAAMLAHLTLGSQH
jgi:CubicO group peptidase (beta-lactamase class C family)